MNHRFLSLALTGACAGALLQGCSGGGGSSPEQGGFQLVGISVPEGASWPINKPIVLTFNAEVDLSTVIAGSTLQLKSTDGSGASAFYEVGYVTDFVSGTVDRTKLIVQPFCPLLGDFSDAGLLPGGTHYQLYVPGESGGSPSTIKALSGAKLELTQKRNFSTPISTNPAVVFEDTGLGAPSVVPQGTFVRLGNGTEIPFVSSGTGHELPATLPLNLYSNPDTQVEFVLQLDQAVDPSLANLDQSLVRIEFLDGTGTWQPFQTAVSLESNCALGSPGAVLVLEPTGILPQDTQVRVVIAEGFSDLIGQESETPHADFLAPTTTLDFESLTPADGGADEAFEPFNVGGLGSFQDTAAVFDTPPAFWGGGALTSGFDFQGTGGPGGDFDWHTPDGVINFKTDFQTITGGPDGVPAFQVNVVGGVLDVNDLVISPSTQLRVQSTGNPLTILATGNVTIAGTINVSGFNAQDVGSLFTPNQPEFGGLGCAGGGAGGTGSFLTSSSTPQGGPGFGPFGVIGAGGGGGETSFNSGTNWQNRRGAGGGGGRFARNQGDGEGLTATAGEPGSGNGAIGGIGVKPQGGQPNSGPFADPDNENDFWGFKGLYTDGALTGIKTGELANPSAGYGGGAGGDSIDGGSFPTIPFVDLSTGTPVYKDKKGAGGGGGGGQLRIICLGKVIFQEGGRILCEGGDGALGESHLSPAFFITGASAGGSGGHVIIESASQIDFSAADQVFISAIGGYGPDPEDESVIYEPTGMLSGGGNGGPGVIQLHVPDPNPETAVGTEEDSAIRLPIGATLADMTSPPAEVLVPTFGARSKARSVWIPMGGASIDPEGGEEAPQFEFDGTVEDDLSEDAGKVVTNAGVVVPPPAILGPEALGAAAPQPFVAADGVTLVLSEDSLQPLITDAGQPSNDVYLRNPALLNNFLLRMEGGTLNKDFDVLAAAYSDETVQLGLITDASTGSLAAFIASQGGPGNVTYQLIPRFFRVQAGSLKDFVPQTAYVKVLFQAARALPNGLPDEENPVVDWTSDITAFNAAPPGDVDFFRWEVEFDLDATGVGLSTSTVPISLDFLRVLFSF